jgi:hypothetical protein
MRRKQLTAAASEQPRRHEQRQLSSSEKPSKPPPVPPGILGARLLYSREEAKHFLNTSESSLRRMEQKRILRPIRPTGSPTGKVHYTGQNLLEVVGG